MWYKLFAVFVVGICLPCQAQVDVKKLVHSIDSLYRSKSSYAKLLMTIQTPRWKRQLELEAWSKEDDYTFIRILSPRKDRGITTLRRQQEMWNFFPKISKVMKIPPSMMTGSWMGSDFTNDDLVKQTNLVKDYKLSLVIEANTYKVTMTPNEDTISVWGKIVLEVEPQTRLPLKQSYYDEKGQKMREMEFLARKRFGNIVLPSELKMNNIAKKDHQTTITYKQLDFGIKLDKNQFTLQNLKTPFK